MPLQNAIVDDEASSNLRDQFVQFGDSRSGLGKGGKITQCRISSGTSVNDITRSPAKALSCSRASANSSGLRPRHSTHRAATSLMGGGVRFDAVSD
jgi:hypothetical protein